jgi:hypothetical protein
MPDTKNGEARTVPLSTTSVEVVRTLPRCLHGDVFPGLTTSISCAIALTIQSFAHPVPFTQQSRSSSQSKSWHSRMGHCHWSGLKGLKVSAKQVSRWRPTFRPQTRCNRGVLSPEWARIFSMTSES